MAVLYGKSPTGRGERMQITSYGQDVRIWVGETSVIVGKEEFIREVGWELDRLFPESTSLADRKAFRRILRG